VLAGTSCTLVYMSMTVLVQHLPGTITTSMATLERLQRGGSRGTCAMYAEFSRTTAGTLRSCVVARWGAPLLEENTRIGAAVQLRIKENAVGWTLVSVTPSSALPTE
jgi:hypothetical protein